jgi:hypothetical protein
VERGFQEKSHSQKVDSFLDSCVQKGRRSRLGDGMSCAKLRRFFQIKIQKGNYLDVCVFTLQTNGSCFQTSAAPRPKNSNSDGKNALFALDTQITILYIYILTTIKTI